MDALMQYIYCLSVCHPSLTPLQACCSLLQREELRDVSEGWSGSLVEAEKNGEKIASESSDETSQCCCENRRKPGTCQPVALWHSCCHQLRCALT
ncbi:hypothetical protein CgunFtcFv8_021951 [Champsocephalus gunnari]|uniref:Uncharacterized protein n=1 Tax=Champsocephalus gunnari TaxID=52237 RepID=A0AAN8DPY1_CHAGU|nr:hypothetical protein CgunFtcFv8_021951 [Champsocephalus gunnari]